MAPALVVEDLVKTYPGGRRSPPVEAVRGISFSVEAGELFGLLGPNGAGKSTTLGCVTTLVRPTRGRILVDGVDVARDPLAARRRIAVVPQNRNLDRDLTTEPLAPRLQAVPGVMRVERVEVGDEVDLERLRLFVDPGDGLLDRVLHAARDGGADLHHVSLAAPSLEDVYIHLTGKELRE
jgi:ABC-2 type transport system ATP-binding protein